MARLNQYDAAYVVQAAVEIAAFLDALPLTIRDREGHYVFNASQVGRIRSLADMLRDKLLRVIPQEIEIEGAEQ